MFDSTSSSDSPGKPLAECLEDSEGRFNEDRTTVRHVAAIVRVGLYPQAEIESGLDVRPTQLIKQPLILPSHSPWPVDCG
jgi:hypothetical protein